VTPTGVGAAPLPSLDSAIFRVIEQLYWGVPEPQMPVTDKHVSHAERNAQICHRHTAGETLEVIAREMGLTPQRVHQIVKRWCHET
jgi:Mor family transcriptional regulator